MQDPTSPQDFNRYSYVGNNPLSFIDPSGYFAEGPAPPPSGGGDFLSFLSRLFGNQPARHNSRYPAWARRLATNQWQAPIVGVVSSFAPTGPWGAAIIGAGLQAAVNGGSVGEVLLVSAAGVSLAMSNRGNGVWSNRSAGNAIRGGGNWLSKLGENGFGNAATTVFQLQEAVAAAAEGEGVVGAGQESQGEQYSPPGWGDYTEVRQPNDDGYLTWGEATWQWRHGEGAPVTVDLDKLDLSGVRQSDFSGPGSRSLFSTAKPKDFLVHGTITLELNDDGAVSALSNKYNFDIKPWTPGTAVRNVEALGGRFLAGPGQEFLIRFQGTVPIPR